MKQAAILLLSIVFITACKQEEPTSYQVPKQSATVAPVAQPMGSDADNQAVLAAHAAMSASAPSGAGYESSLPAGWAEISGSGMRKASYKIEGTSIDFYLISLSTGDLTSNVNRWRGQVGLAPDTEETVEQAAETMEIDGHSMRYIEIYNEEGGKGIIAAIIDLAPQYWYFTAKGSVAELKENAADIRKFLESIKFEGHNH